MTGWRKSSYSRANGDCLEAASGDGQVQARDTADRDGVTLAVPVTAWLDFTAAVRDALYG